MSTPRVDVPESSSSEKWKDIFNGQVQKDDPMWNTYLKEAEVFDNRIVDEWNKIIDVILVYVALFIAVLASFVLETSKQFKPDPGDISNQLLAAIYQQLVAQSNNTLTPINIINTTSIFQLDKIDYDRAVTCNSLLYSGLAICIVVSMVALAAKLWLVDYRHRAFDSVGSPYERAIKRQEAYSGVLAWKMGAVIHTLPLMLLIALIMFGFYIHISLDITQQAIAYVVGTVLTLGLISLIIVSLAAVFIPACPFHSSFSTAIRLVLEFPLELCRKLSRQMGFKGRLPEVSQTNVRLLEIGGFLGSSVVIGYFTSAYSTGIFVLVFIPISMIFAYSTQGEAIQHKPQRYRLPLWSLCFFLFIASFLSAAGYFSRRSSHVFIPLYVIGMLLLILFGWMADRLSKSMNDTGKIDAIAWLLKTPLDQPDNRDLFKKAGQIASSPDGSDYKPRLLELLFPLLASLIKARTAEPDDSQLKYLEVYVSCLAQLSDFPEDPGRGYALLWEDAKRHPNLPVEDPRLCKELKELAANPRYKDDSNLKNAATALVKIYGLNDQGEERSKSRRPQISSWGTSGSITTLVKPEERVELDSMRKDGYLRVEV